MLGLYIVVDYYQKFNFELGNCFLKIVLFLRMKIVFQIRKRIWLLFDRKQFCENLFGKTTMSIC